MAKMLMGQITHARERIQTITAQLEGAKPELPKAQDADEVLKAIRNGDVVVTPTQLRRALDNFVNRTPVDVIKSHGGNWSCTLRDYAPKRLTLEETVRSNLGECLVDVVAPASYARDLDNWKEEQELWEERSARVAEQAVVVEDAIVLGDQQAALIALQAFANFTP